MRNIQCRSCGCRYDYAKEGMCPNCGAYNRPPRRETVEADGVVHHLDIAEEVTPARGKVCYEEKECHEEMPRKVRQGKGAESAAALFKKLEKNIGVRTAGKKKAEVKIAVILVIISLLCTIISNLAAKREPAFPEPESSIAQAEEWATPSGGNFAQTKDGRFDIVDWDLNGSQLVIYYAAEFDPIEKGTAHMEFVTEDGKYEMVPPVEGYYDYRGKGTMTFEASAEESKPMGLYLEYKNEAFWLPLQ